jgi:hypothetical protein
MGGKTESLISWYEISSSFRCNVDRCSKPTNLIPPPLSVNDPSKQYRGKHWRFFHELTIFIPWSVNPVFAPRNNSLQFDPSTYLSVSSVMAALTMANFSVHLNL